MKRHLLAVAVCLLAWPGPVLAQERGAARRRADSARITIVPIVLKSNTGLGRALRLMHSSDWIVVVEGAMIKAAGPANEIELPVNARTLDLAGMTILPGLIDAHTHVLLHPYDEALWDDQVLKEALALRVCRATNHLRSILLSGFTTIRDLGTEGAGYADVGLKQAVEQGIIPGPHMLVVTRAIVATGSYAPKGFAPELRIPQGAEEADGVDSLIRTVRDQIGKGADWIKVYADAAMGGAAVRPSFSAEELTRIVETAGSAGVLVTAHAMSKEGMRRAGHGGSRNHRAWRRRRLRSLQIDGRSRSRTLPDARGFRGIGTVSRLSPRQRPGTTPPQARSGRTLSWHSKPESRSPTAATWGSLLTAMALAS